MMSTNCSSQIKCRGRNHVAGREAYQSHRDALPDKFQLQVSTGTQVTWLQKRKNCPAVMSKVS